MRVSKCLFCLLLLIFVPQVTAEVHKRALLVGVGDYGNVERDLPGIPTDIINMRQALQYMGYKRADIRILLNEQATARAILREMNEWLVGEDDLLYFSGHGTQVPDQNGDEPDGLDEVLMPHDAREQVYGDTSKLENVLLDDDIGAWLERRGARRTLLVLDACSTSGAMRNSLTWSSGVRPAAVMADLTFGKAVLMAAARSGEEAPSGISGSPYTTAWTRAVRRRALAGNEFLDFRDLQAQLELDLSDYAESRPVLNQELKTDYSGITLKGELAETPFSAHFVTQRMRGELKLLPSESEFQIGDRVGLRLMIPEPGYLQLFAIDRRDQLIQIYPHPRIHGSGKVKAGLFQLGSDALSELRASGPAGSTMVVAHLNKARPARSYTKSHWGDSLSTTDFVARLGNRSKGNSMMGYAEFRVNEGGR